MPSTLVEVKARCERIAWKTKCFRDVDKVLNSTAVELILANTHKYKPQSCRSLDGGCFPEMTRTAIDLSGKIYKREPHERVGYLATKRRILRRK